MIKKLGKDAALVGSSGEPPKKHVSMNGVVVLIRPIESSKPSNVMTPLVAGPKLKAKPVRESGGQPQEDPWMQYRLKNNMTVTQAPKPPDAPTASKFQAIENRLAMFETSMQQMQMQTEAFAKSFESQASFQCSSRPENDNH